MSSYSIVVCVVQIRDILQIWKLLCCLAAMDHVEGMSVALLFVIINPGCVRENSASFSIKDRPIMTITQANGMPLCWNFKFVIQLIMVPSLFINVTILLHTYLPILQ